MGNLSSVVAEDREPACDLGRQPGPLVRVGRVPLDSVSPDVSGASNGPATVYGRLRRLDDPPRPLRDPSEARCS